MVQHERNSLELRLMKSAERCYRNVRITPGHHRPKYLKLSTKLLIVICKSFNSLAEMIIL